MLPTMRAWIVIAAVLLALAISSVAADGSDTVTESYLLDGHRITYEATYLDGDTPQIVWDVARDGDISHCEMGCTSADGWDNLADITAGDIKMPDDVVMQSDDLVEWIEYKGRPSQWTTGNNYAVPGTPHAQEQRQMLKVLKELPSTSAAKLMLTTAVEFMARMAKAGLKLFGPLMFLPDATAANEGSEIYTDSELTLQECGKHQKRMATYTFPTMTINGGQKPHQNESTSYGYGNSSSGGVYHESVEAVWVRYEYRRELLKEQSGWPSWKVHMWASDHPGQWTIPAEDLCSYNPLG